MNILVIDDCKYHIEALGGILLRRGHAVLAARDGEHGLDVLERNAESINFIITDSQMPKMDGYTFSRKAKLNFPNIPIVMHTASILVTKNDDLIAVVDKGEYEQLIKLINDYDNDWPIDRSCDA